MSNCREVPGGIEPLAQARTQRRHTVCWMQQQLEGTLSCPWKQEDERERTRDYQGLLFRCSNSSERDLGQVYPGLLKDHPGCGGEVKLEDDKLRSPIPTE